MNLKLVQVIFRHGARTPLLSPDYLPKIEYSKSQMTHPEHTIIPYVITELHDEEIVIKHNTTWGETKGDHGQLTSVGAEQLYQLGCFLRKKYLSELDFVKDPSQVYARSTGVKRTVESARSVLAGLFPGHTAQFPIHVAPPTMEVLYPNFQICNYIRMLNRWAYQNECFLREDIQNQFNISPEHKVHLVTLRDCLFVHKFHDMLPAEFDKPEAMTNLERVSVEIMDYVFAGHGEASLKLASGPLLTKLLENMDQSISNQPNKEKLILLSGHDTTLIPFLHTLNIHDSKWPPYAANVTLELYECSSDQKYYVQVLYENEKQLLPGCSDVMCPLNEFKAAVSKYLVSPDEYTKLC
uniref:Lysophosphatidic acid phosphatase type 6 n=1 Tax=Ciona savignyi TaxID=51511 RepID=H2YF55_CIOSA